MTPDELNELPIGLYEINNTLFTGFVRTRRAVKLPGNRWSVFTANETMEYTTSEMSEIVEKCRLIYQF